MSEHLKDVRVYRSADDAQNKETYDRVLKLIFNMTYDDFISLKGVLEGLCGILKKYKKSDNTVKKSKKPVRVTKRVC